jgi:DNA-binding NtrC family response regulator
LRERRADIPLLAAQFMSLQNSKFDLQMKGLDPEAMVAITCYDWPGNIREMKNVIEACMAMESGDYLTLQVLNQFIEIPAKNDAPAEDGGADGDYNAAMSRFEAEYLRGLLDRYQWNVEAAARDAGMNMATMYRKMKKYAIRKE